MNELRLYWAHVSAMLIYDDYLNGVPQFGDGFYFNVIVTVLQLV